MKNIEGESLFVLHLNLELIVELTSHELRKWCCYVVLPKRFLYTHYFQAITSLIFFCGGGESNLILVKTCNIKRLRECPHFQNIMFNINK